MPRRLQNARPAGGRDLKSAAPIAHARHEAPYDSFTRLLNVWDLTGGVAGADRQAQTLPSDATALSRVWNQLTLLEAAARGGAPADEDLAIGIYKHMLDAVDLAATMISYNVMAEAAVTVKLLWRQPDGSAVVRTLLRNRRSRLARETYRPLNNFSYRGNTAFEDIVERGQAHFAADNLLVLEAMGRYKNCNNYWPEYYNSTAVVPIPEARDGRGGIVGFLCADSYYGRLDDTDKVIHPLAVMAEHLYNIFGLALETTAEKPRKSSAKASDAACQLGWVFLDGALTPHKEERQMAFQDAVHLIENAGRRSENSTHARAYPRVGGDAPAPSGGRSMELDEDWTGLLTDNDMDPHRVAALKRLGELSEADHVKILEQIAPENPYAQQLLDGARAKKPS